MQSTRVYRGHERDTLDRQIDDRHDRFTIELGFGVGLTRMREDGRDATTQSAWSPSLGVGWWRGANAATLRIATGVFHRDLMSEPDPTTAGVFLGPAAQHWFGDVGFVGAGGGVLALVDDADWTVWPGGDLRAGVAFAHLGHVALTASAEATAGILETGLATHVSLQLGVQRW